MIKVTSSKAIKDYLFLSLILPIKNVSSGIVMKSPIIGDDGAVWNIVWATEELNEHTTRNYQRRRLNNRRNLILLLVKEGRTLRIGYFDKKTKQARLYSRPLKEIGAGVLLGRIFQEMNDNTPFTKVIIDDSDGYRGLEVRSYLDSTSIY